PSVLVAIANEGAQAVLLLPDSTFYIGRTELARLALRHQLAMIGTLAEYARDGALMSYGSNVSAEWRRAGMLVGKILNGIKPRDIPIEESSSLELVINLKTAKALGLTIPPSRLSWCIREWTSLSRWSHKLRWLPRKRPGKSRSS